MKYSIPWLTDHNKKQRKKKKKKSSTNMTQKSTKLISFKKKSKANLTNSNICLVKEIGTQVYCFISILFFYMFKVFCN